MRGAVSIALAYNKVSLRFVLHTNFFTNHGATLSLVIIMGTHTASQVVVFWV